jgi:hypothetical protein
LGASNPEAAGAIRAHILRIDADDTTVSVLTKGKTRMGRRGV